MEIATGAHPIDPDGPDDDTRPPTKQEAPATPFSWHRLFHRWFVEYNPLYLVSALLVLGGLTAISRGAAESSRAHPEVVVAAIAELYAFALIAGAAFLMRLGLRRPAVMLCLVTALYQCDLTLLTERQVYLGLTGALAVAGWLAMFVAKLYGVAWAMRLRLSRSAVAVPAFGALGMALLPHLLQQGDRSDRTAVVAVWYFALFAAGLFTSREVTSKEPLDAWGNTVLRRALRGTWALWAGLLTVHVLFWCSESRLSPDVLVAVGLLLATRWMRGEMAVWAAVAGAALFTRFLAPREFWVVALLCAVTLGLRALRRPTRVEIPADEPQDVTPYRASGSEAPPPRFVMGFARSDRAAMIRLLTGSLFGVYLSAWTIGWSGDDLPPHVLLLDATLVAAAALAAYRERTKVVLAPLVPTSLHAGVQVGILSLPTSALQWGIASVGTGFVLLLGSLAIAWRLRAAPEAAAGAPPS